MRTDLDKLFKWPFFGFSLIALIQMIHMRVTWIFGLERPTATDSYYYLQDFSHLLDHGRGYYSAYSTFLLFAGLLSKLFSLNEILLLNVISLLNVSLLSLSLALLITRRTLIWLLPAVITLPWMSDLVFFRAYAFPRMFLSLGLLFVIFSLLIRVSTLEAEKISAGRFTLPLFLGIMFGASIHALGTLIAAIWILFVYCDRIKIALITSVAAALPVLFYAHITRKCLFAFPLLEFSSLLRGPCGKMICSPFEQKEYSMLLLGCCGIAFYLWWFHPKSRALYVFPLTVLIFSLPIWDRNSGLALRLYLTSAWLMMFTGAVILFYSRHQNSIANCLAVFCSLYFLGFCVLNHTDYRTENPTVPLLAKHSQSLRYLLPQDSFILAPHGLQFAVTYYTGRASANHLPVHANYSAVYILSHGVNDPNCVEGNQTNTYEVAIPECIALGGNAVFQKISPRPLSGDAKL